MCLTKGVNNGTPKKGRSVSDEAARSFPRGLRCNGSTLLLCMVAGGRRSKVRAIPLARDTRNHNRIHNLVFDCSPCHTRLSVKERTCSPDTRVAPASQAKIIIVACRFPLAGFFLCDKIVGMQKNTSSFISTILAGALAGAVTSIVILHNPEKLGRFSVTPQNLDDAGKSSQFVATSNHEDAVVRAVKQAQPAVVSIVISKDVPIIERYYNDFFGGGFFSPFQFQVPQLRQNGTQKQEVGGGSGFLVSADGLIVTNKHVVSDEDAQYTVFLNDGSKHEAKLVARDPLNDIAVIKIDGNNFPFLQFADSGNLQVGQSVIAIGNALGEFKNTVSTGVVAGLSRSITAGDSSGQSEQLNEVIQTDAAINPGNSGGPLLNLSGQVIGVNVAIAQGSQNVGFALPANGIKSTVESVQKTGKISRAYIGVRYTQITPTLKDTNKLSVDYGALMVRGESADELAVIPGSPANKVGIVEGDIILEADGKKLEGDTTLSSIISKKQVGDTVRLKVLSKGDEKTVSVKLDEMKS